MPSNAKAEICETHFVSDLALTLTKALAAALVEITGEEPVGAEPVVVVAAYIDALAKDYGLSESLMLDADPMERTQQVEPVMAIVRRAFQADAGELDADLVRSRIYDAVATLASDPGVRRALNRNQPLPEGRLLHLVQVYWNLEATPERSKLPIKRTNEGDIPVPGFRSDFATMTWTARVNQKGNYKSAGQSFRTQGARLAVLLAQHLVTRTARPQDSPAQELEVLQTSDPEKPLAITLRDLAWRAWTQGDYDDAVELSASHFNIVSRRAAAAPFDTESDLAEAHYLRGAVGMRPKSDSWWSGDDVLGIATDDLEKAVASFTMLAQLEPHNEEHNAKAVDALVALCLNYRESSRLADSVQTGEQAVTLAEMSATGRPEDAERQGRFVLALMTLWESLSDAGRVDDSVAALARAVPVAERLTRLEPEKSTHGAVLVAIHWGLSRELRESGRFDQAVHVASRAVALSEQMDTGQVEDRQRLASSAVGLGDALSDAGRYEEALAAAGRAVSIREGLARADPDNSELQANLAWVVLFLARVFRAARRFDDIVVAASRAADLFAQLAATEPEAVPYRAGLAAARKDLGDALRELGRLDEAQAVDDEDRGQ